MLYFLSLVISIKERAADDSALMSNLIFPVLSPEKLRLLHEKEVGGANVKELPPGSPRDEGRERRLESLWHALFSYPSRVEQKAANLSKSEVLEEQLQICRRTNSVHDGNGFEYLKSTDYFMQAMPIIEKPAFPRNPARAAENMPYLRSCILSKQSENMRKCKKDGPKFVEDAVRYVQKNDFTIVETQAFARSALLE